MGRRYWWPSGSTDASALQVLPLSDRVDAERSALFQRLAQDMPSATQRHCNMLPVLIGSTSYLLGEARRIAISML
jgi:hypothetical protein